MAIGFQFAFQGPYLNISASYRSGWLSSSTHRVPLCRLRYTGDLESWRFEIYRHSTRGYDTEHDFPFDRGSVEECFAVAADFYLLEHDALEAGSSRHRKPGQDGEPPGGPGASFQGAGKLLPSRDAPDAPWPPDEAGPDLLQETAASIPEAVVTAGTVLLEDLDAVCGFIEGRTLALAPRTLGFGRADLAAVNALMHRPAPLHQRAVIADAPAVAVCFATGAALGLLRVIRTRHRAEATEAVARFRALPPSARWWTAIEALWQRVPWASLNPRAFGSSDGLQAGRRFLASALARSRRAIPFDFSLTLNAEVLETYLFPAWRDAGLLALDLARAPGPSLRASAKGKPTVRSIRVTELGRWTFERLARLSPGSDSEEVLQTLDRQPRLSGNELLLLVQAGGLQFSLDPDW